MEKRKLLQKKTLILHTITRQNESNRAGSLMARAMAIGIHIDVNQKRFGE